MKPKAAREDKWLKNQQKLHVSDIAESFVSVIQAPQASYNNQLLTLYSKWLADKTLAISCALPTPKAGTNTVPPFSTMSVAASTKRFSSSGLGV